MRPDKESAMRGAAAISNNETRWVPYEITRFHTREFGGHFEESSIGRWDIRPAKSPEEAAEADAEYDLLPITKWAYSKSEY